MKERNSSIELLRIMAAMAVVVVHYNYNIAYRLEGVGGAIYFCSTLLIVLQFLQLIFLWLLRVTSRV